MKFLLAFLSFLIMTVGTSTVAFAADAATTPALIKSTSVQANTLVNINTADAQALTQLKGIGPKKAEAIVAWRKANGQFKTLEQLMDVKGIGESIFKANQGKISL